MNRETFYRCHRAARIGNLGTLAAFVPRQGAGDHALFAWFLREVFGIRFPHLGDNRHPLNGVRSFDNLAGGFRSRRWLRIATGQRVAA